MMDQVTACLVALICGLINLGLGVSRPDIELGIVYVCSLNFKQKVNRLWSKNFGQISHGQIRLKFRQKCIYLFYFYSVKFGQTYSELRSISIILMYVPPLLITIVMWLVHAQFFAKHRPFYMG